MSDLEAAATPAAETAPEAPPPPSAPPAPAAEPDERSAKERARDRLAALRASLKAKTADIKVEPAADQPADDAKPDDSKLKADDESEPEPKPKGQEKDLELDLAKAKRAAANASEDLRETRAELKALKERTTADDASRAKIKDDPVASLAAFKEIFGRSFGEYTRWLVENKATIESQQKYADLPPDVREELELAKQERAERVEQAAQAAQAAKSSKYSANVTQYLTDNAEDFPLASAAEWAAAHLVATHGVGKVRPEHIKAFEEGLAKTYVKDFSNERVIEWIVNADEKVLAATQAAIAKALSKKQAPTKSPTVASPTNGTPAPADGPRGLSNSASPGTVVRSQDDKPTRKELLVAGIQRLRAEKARAG